MRQFGNYSQQPDASGYYNHKGEALFHWVSRHKLTDGQMWTLADMFRHRGFTGVEVIHHQGVVFGDNPVDDLAHAGVPANGFLGIVAPLNICLAVLRTGRPLVEFVNVPSARQRGVFICQGAWFHTSLQESVWETCELSPEEQETGSLEPVKGA